MKGNDHKGCQGHSLIISYQAPLHAPVDNWTGVPERTVGLLLGQQPRGRLLQLFR